jgi:hypothetical protein
MSALSVEERLAALEAEVGQLKQRLESPVTPTMPWWEKISGTFAGDPIYKEAMKLGHQYRRSLHRAPRKRKANDVPT